MAGGATGEGRRGFREKKTAPLKPPFEAQGKQGAAPKTQKPSRHSGKWLGRFPVGDNPVFRELGIRFFVGRSTVLLDSGKDDLGYEFCQRIAPQFRIVLMSVLRARTTTNVNLR